MKGLVQVSSALYSLAAFIMYIPQGGGGWGVGGRGFWGVLFGEKRGGGKHFWRQEGEDANFFRCH